MVSWDEQYFNLSSTKGGLVTLIFFQSEKKTAFFFFFDILRQGAVV